MRKSEAMPEPTEAPYSPGVAAIFEVVARLRAPGGCPWDREQTHESLRPYLLEETYELLEAIDSGDDAKIKEELGDLLLQVAMHAEIAAEQRRFDAAQVLEAVAAKMVARHPHVFGDVTVAAFGSFMYATFVPGYQPLAGSANLITGANNTNWKQWVVGLQFGYAGFTVGGSYGYDNLGLGGNYYTGVDNDNRKYTAGIMYETGPWQASVGWGRVVNNNGNGSVSALGVVSGTSVIQVAAAANSSAAFGTNLNTGALSFGTEQADKFEIGASYALGPGIKVLGGGVYYNVAGQSNLTAQQSWQLFLGMDLRF